MLSLTALSSTPFLHDKLHCPIPLSYSCTKQPACHWLKFLFVIPSWVGKISEGRRHLVDANTKVKRIDEKVGEKEVVNAKAAVKGPAGKLNIQYNFKYRRRTDLVDNDVRPF